MLDTFYAFADNYIYHLKQRSCLKIHINPNVLLFTNYKQCGLLEKEIIEMIRLFSEQHNINITTDKTILEDVTLPGNIKSSNLDKYSIDGIMASSENGKMFFITHSIENALIFCQKYQVVFVEQTFYLTFLESFIRAPLIKFVSVANDKLFWKTVFNWILFLGVHFLLFFFFSEFLVSLYVFFFCIKATLIFFTNSFIKNKNSNIVPANKVTVNTDLLPIVTILVPLYKEKEVLSQLLTSLKAINYPYNLLDIKFVTEADDFLTNNTLKSLFLPDNCRIIPVPVSSPRTKAKAVNYAVRFALGSYICIYDAEDIPHPNQVITAIKEIQRHHKNGNKNVFSVQCPLSWYNCDTNVITAMMSIEYRILFKQIIPALSELNGFIALGGTSNFFIKHALQKLGYWNSSNVTEDFDLAIRGAISGNWIKFCDIETQEECVDSFKAWAAQRSRWLKGFIVSIGSNFLQIHSKLWKRPFGIIGFYVFGWITMLQPIMNIILLINLFNFHLITTIELNVALAILNLVIILPNCKQQTGIVKKIATAIIFLLYNMLFIIPFIYAIYDIICNYTFWKKTNHTKLKNSNC
ncbi:MAG: glycosyltransferase [Alphaproteobacteria bacterium]|nr:glycosyltransferase [Rickettsiales bacterium]